MENVDEGRPLGEMFTCLPVRGAEAVKKTCWSSAWAVIRSGFLDSGYLIWRKERGRTQSRRLSGMESQNCTIAQIAEHEYCSRFIGGVNRICDRKYGLFSI